jgi:hypothetical protein
MPRQPHKKRTEALEHRRQDDTACLREWRRWRSEEVARAIAGPHGAIIRTLIETCRAAPLWSDIEPAQVLAPFVGLDPDTHALARRIVSSFVAAKREATGLVPLDDPIPF